MTPTHPLPRAVLLLTLSLGLTLHADPFEGNIHLLVGGFAPVWMDLQVPKSDGPVTGTYFYKKVGKEIPLKGEVKGAVVSLSEYGAKQSVTGLFTLTRFDDSLAGTWNSHKGALPQRVSLYRANPGDRLYAKMPKLSDLILSNGESLAQKIREGQDEAEVPKNKSPKVDLELFRKGVLCLSYGIEYMGAYSTSIGYYHTFDLAARPKREIVLHNEIDPRQRRRFHELLRRKIQAELTDYRKSATDDEWHDLFEDRLRNGDGDPDSLLNEIFLLPKDPDPNSAQVDTSLLVQDRNDSSGDHYYFTEQGLQYHVSHYWGFPHVIQSQDFYCQIDFSFAELKPYLKKGSPLARFTP